MTMNPLPPQAYTRETLQKAYNWLLTQSPSIKDMARNQDILVSLYLKAQRNGDAALEAPSIQNFKKELKSLATMMGDFQPSEAAPVTAPKSAAAMTAPQATQNVIVEQVAMPAFIETATSTPAASATITVAASTAALGLDSASLQAIHDVRQTLNLSSDAEALRALIALGSKQFKKIHS